MMSEIRLIEYVHQQGEQIHRYSEHTHLPLLTIIRVDDHVNIQVDQLEFAIFCNLSASLFRKLGADL